MSKEKIKRLIEENSRGYCMSGRTLTFIRGAAIGFTPVVWGWSLLDWQWWVFFICSNIAFLAFRGEIARDSNKRLEF